MCEIAGVSRSAYYKYKKNPPKEDTRIEDLIVDLFEKSGKRAGYRTIRYLLRNTHNLRVNHKKIQRIMREREIQSIVRKKKNVHPKEELVRKENLLNRDFQSGAPGMKFVTDITFIPTPRTMVYLCTIIDLFNNEPVAWNINTSQDKSLSIDTIRKLSERYDLKNAIIHSDQGVHYTNKAYVDMLKDLKVMQSMSRKGNCWDNAKAESFFSHLKCETIHLMKKRIQGFDDVKEIVEEYMDYYTNQRPQKTLGGLSPRAYREAYIS